MRARNRIGPAAISGRISEPSLPVNVIAGTGDARGLIPDFVRGGKELLDAVGSVSVNIIIDGVVGVDSGEATNSVIGG